MRDFYRECACTLHVCVGSLRVLFVPLHKETHLGPQPSKSVGAPLNIVRCRPLLDTSKHSTQPCTCPDVICCICKEELEMLCQNSVQEQFILIIHEVTGYFFLKSKVYSLDFSYGKIGIKVALTVTFAFSTMSQICVYTEIAEKY